MYPSGRHRNVVWLHASPGAEVGDGPSMQLGTRAPSPSWRTRPQSARGRVGPRHPRRHGPRVGPAPPKPPLSAAPARASGLRRTAAGLARSDHSRGCSSDSQRLGAAVPRVERGEPSPGDGDDRVAGRRGVFSVDAESSAQSASTAGPGPPEGPPGSRGWEVPFSQEGPFQAGRPELGHGLNPGST